VFLPLSLWLCVCVCVCVCVRASGFAVPGEARPAGVDAGASGSFGGDVPEKRRATTEKEKQMLAQLTEEHMRLRDER
jgi:hypothetical protein